MGGGCSWKQVMFTCPHAVMTGERLGASGGVGSGGALGAMFMSFWVSICGWSKRWRIVN